VALSCDHIDPQHLLLRLDLSGEWQFLRASTPGYRVKENLVPHPTRVDARRPLPSWGEAEKGRDSSPSAALRASAEWRRSYREAL
jgi:hypothetical protein